jgi:signal transduction histidine kinase
MARRRRKARKPRKTKTKTTTRRARSARPRAATPRAIETALAGVAHDIRTPLTGILALAELLAASDLGPRERQWAVAVKSGAEHLAALSTLIVDAARADAAGLVLRHEPFAPTALAQAVAEGIAARAANKGVAVTASVSPDLPARVAGDALRLRAALENLADNAVKFTERGGVRFTAAAAPARGKRVRLIFELADSGIGMSAAELKTLFRPFAQASAEVARRYGGAGLGLTFVKRIAKAMGGDLTVKSAKGKGSTFRLTALVERVDTADAPAPGRAASRALTLLCAEDNPYGRVIMNTILGELGHRADFVSRGEAAV